MMRFLSCLFQARPSWLRWVGRGFWAVVDQALFAGTNFLVGVLLARWLEPEAYGAFSTAYSVFLLIGTLYTALWTEPMLVYGPGRLRVQFEGYLRVLMAYHWRFGGLVFLAFMGTGIFFLCLGQSELGKSFLGLAAAAPSILFLWLVRRGAYVHLEPHLAAYGGGFYLASYLGLAFVLLQTDLLNEVTAFLAMALAALLAAAGIRLRLKARISPVVDPGEVWALHWGYGRWALLAGALSWVPGNIYYVVLPVFRGLEAVAQFKALMNLLMPILHFNGALGSLLVPGMVRARPQGGLGQFAGISLAIFVAFAFLYWAILVWMGREMIGWLYEGKYVQASIWLPWLGFLPVLASISSVMSSSLRALEKPEVVASVYAFLALFASVTGIPLVRMYGLGGAVYALLLVNTLSAFAFWWRANREG